MLEEFQKLVQIVSCRKIIFKIKIHRFKTDFDVRVNTEASIHIEPTNGH